MKTSRMAYVRKAFGALALVGCLVLGALPLGQIPRITGPCGRVLCECPTVTISCHGPSGEVIEREAPQSVWTLATVKPGNAINTTAFVLVISDFDQPAPVLSPDTGISSPSEDICSADDSALPAPIHKIPTPPPRHA
ncbi:MAG TPA: hypothetical protein VEK08_00970 [Planctomycetota bacterium]|nr:hypothetical protein [Planctomycetota bacterium]